MPSCNCRKHGCKKCAPAPCRQVDPAVCEPPPTTDTPSSVVVIDTNGCYRLLVNPDDTAPFLIWDSATSTLKWVNGDIGSGKGFYLGDVTANTVSSAGLIGVDPATSMMEVFSPDNSVDVPAIPVVQTVGGNVFWLSVKALILQLWSVAGAAYGVFTRNSTGDLVVVDGSDGDVIQKVGGEWVAVSLSIPAQNLPFGVENLQIRTEGYTDGSTGDTITATADKVVVYDGATPKTLINFNKTADITASGVNGLDTGVVVAETWYYLYAIYNGVSQNSILSASSVTPVLPAGYTFFRIIGVTRSVGGGGLYNSYQNDDRFYWHLPYSLGSRDQTTDNSLDVIPFFGNGVPPIATAYDAHISVGSTVANKVVLMQINGHPSTTCYNRQNKVRPALTENDAQYDVINIPIVNSSPAWKASHLVDTSGSYTADIEAIGFRL